jgi:hypothetical protein
MIDNIIEPTMNYDFNKLQLGIPVAHPSSTYITRLFMQNKPIYMQTPKCTTKAGFVTSGKKIYCDLMFQSDDSIFIDWVTNLELKCHSLICEKGESWFQTTYTKDDIESAFVSPLKIYKAGKYYILRVNVKPTMKVYNDLNAEIPHSDINDTTTMITIIEFYGIKFTSRNFQMEVELKQSMIVSPDDFLGNCFIKPTNKNVQQQQQPLEEPQPLEPLEEPPTTTTTTTITNVPTVETSTVDPPTLEDYPNVPTVELVVEKSPILIESESEEEEENTIVEPFVSIEPLELSEMDFDISERLEESEPLHLKRPIDQYYSEYNTLITKADKLKSELRRIYLEAQILKEKHSLVVNEINKDIDSDMDDISDNEDEDEDDI